MAFTCTAKSEVPFRFFQIPIVFRPVDVIVVVVNVTARIRCVFIGQVGLGECMH